MDICSSRKVFFGVGTFMIVKTNEGEGRLFKAPVVVRVDCRTYASQRQGLIKWTPPEEENPEGLKYKVEAATDFAPNVWKVLPTAENPRYTARTSNTERLVQLSAWANYTFRVTASGEHGVSAPGLSGGRRQRCRTLPGAPTKYPDDIKVANKFRNEILVTWKPMILAEQNGPYFSYVVSWQCTESRYCTDRRHSVQARQGESQFLIDGIPVDALVIIEVKAINSRGSKSHTILYRLPPNNGVSHRPNPPLIVSIDCKTYTSQRQALIRWSQDEDPTGFEYTVEGATKFAPKDWKVLPAADNPQYSAPTGRSNTERLVQLTPGAVYTFRLIATDTQNEARGSSFPGSPSTVNCATLPDRPYKNPAGVAVRAVAPQIIAITWTPLPRSESHGPGFHYEIFWKCSNNPKCEQTYSKRISSSHSEMAAIYNVPYPATYTVKVIAVNHLGESTAPAIPITAEIS
ncbi:contactin-5-like isoform X2 [Tubulanus polymorphus]|uniref:contactin-5-like isoform X2 n=1 Tax=Tubulanus polymorphus TaxID=672921 RepID=UPI003DA5D2FE